MMKVLFFFLSSVLGWGAVAMVVAVQQEDDVSTFKGRLGMGFNKKHKLAPDGVTKEEEIKCTSREFKRMNHEIFMVIAQQAGFSKEEATNLESWSSMQDVELELDVIEAGCVSDFTNIHGSETLEEYFKTLDNGLENEDIICPTKMEYTCYEDGEVVDGEGKEDDETRRRRRARLLQGVEDVSMLPEEQKTRGLCLCCECSLIFDWTQCIGCFRRRKGRNLREPQQRQLLSLTEVELQSLTTVGIALCEQINDPDMGHSGIPCVDCSSFKVWLESGSD